MIEFIAENVSHEAYEAGMKKVLLEMSDAELDSMYDVYQEKGYSHMYTCDKRH
jgi:hypothetical protein